MPKDYFNEFLLEDWQTIDKELSSDRWFRNGEPSPNSSGGEVPPPVEQQQDMLSSRPTFDRHKQESRKDRMQRVKDEYNARPYIGIGAGIRKRRQARLATLAELSKDEVELRKERIKRRHPELDEDDLVKVAPDEQELETEAQLSSLLMETTSNPRESQTPIVNNTRKKELAQKIEELKKKRKGPKTEARPSSVSHDSTVTHTNPEGFGYNVASVKGFAKKTKINKYATVKAALNQLDQYIERSEDDEYKLPKLPYDYDALEPWIDKETMELHHKKHHKSYVDGLNEALAALKEDVSVKDLMRKVAFNGSGHILHSLFWNSLSIERGNKKPEGAFAEAVDRDFGSFRDMQKQFVEAASTVEGSGWGLLVVEPYTRRLMILQAEKHQNLAVQGSIPIMAVDVWEHAYYLLYKNNREKYVNVVFSKLLDWEKIGQRYEEIIMADMAPKQEEVENQSDNKAEE